MDGHGFLEGGQCLTSVAEADVGGDKGEGIDWLASIQQLQFLQCAPGLNPLTLAPLHIDCRALNPVGRIDVARTFDCSERVGEPALLHVGVSNHVRPGKVRIQVQDGAKLFDGSVILAREIENGTGVRLNNQGEGIKLTGALQLGERFVEATNQREVLGEPVVSGGVIGVQGYRAAEFLFGVLPVPIVILRDQSKRDVSLGELFIEFQGVSAAARALGMSSIGGATP